MHADVPAGAHAEILVREPDDGGIDLDGVDVHLRFVMGQEANHRAAAQADDEHATRMRLIEVAGEHAAGVRRHQGVGCGQIDAALHRLLAVVAHER